MARQNLDPAHSAAIGLRLWRNYVRPHRMSIVIAVSCMILTAVCMGVFVHLIQPLIDDVLKPGHSTLLYKLPFAIVGLFLVKGLAEYTQNYLMQRTGMWVVADIQSDLHERLIRQDSAFFLTHTTSNLTSSFLFDMQRMRGMMTNVITGSMRDASTVVAMSANLLYSDWRMAIVALIVLPLVLVPVKRIGKKMRKYSGKSQVQSGDLAGLLHESFASNRLVKAFGMEDYEIGRTSKAINFMRDTLLKTSSLRAITSPMVEFIGMSSFAVVIFYAANQVQSGHLTAGGFTSFITALLLIYRPLKGLSNVNNAYQDGVAAAERAFELMDNVPQIVSAPDAPDLTVTKGEVVMRDLSFVYPDGTAALHNLNLTIPSGSTVAVVGPSGAGKSTLLNLLPRFFDPSGGDISIDGQNIKGVTITSLRRNIGLVSQEVAMLNDTIYNNIAYGRESATRAEIEQAAKDAAAHEFIVRQEQGYDTMVGEGGMKLSGGQRQRIAIARALLHDAPVLLLDEATSSLDTESERAVQEALKRLMKGRTTLVVAHRLSTVVDADKIYVLEHGHVSETGTHSELLKHKGTYARLYNLQTQGAA